MHSICRYSVMAGTPEKMLEYLLETRLDSSSEETNDDFLEDFVLTHVIFMPYTRLCPALISQYPLLAAAYIYFWKKNLKMTKFRRILTHFLFDVTFQNSASNYIQSFLISQRWPHQICLDGRPYAHPSVWKNTLLSGQNHGNIAVLTEANISFRPDI